MTTRGSHRLNAQPLKSALPLHPLHTPVKQVQVFPVLQIRGSHNPLLGFNYFARVAHRNLENSALTRLPIYYKGIQLRSSQRKRCIGPGTWEGLRASTPSPGEQLSRHLIRVGFPGSQPVFRGFPKVTSLT